MRSDWLGGANTKTGEVSCGSLASIEGHLESTDLNETSQCGCGFVSRQPPYGACEGGLGQRHFTSYASSK